MLKSIYHITSSIFFLSMVIMTSWKLMHGTLSWDTSAILYTLANIGLMMNAEYARRADRDEKEDARRNQVYTVKTVLHG